LPLIANLVNFPAKSVQTGLYNLVQFFRGLKRTSTESSRIECLESADKRTCPGSDPSKWSPPLQRLLRRTGSYRHGHGPLSVDHQVSIGFLVAFKNEYL